MEYLSEEGLNKLKEKLNELKTTRRKDVAQRLEHAKSLGDLSENAEYQETKEEQFLLELEIEELEKTIRNAVLIQKASDNDRVRIGSTTRVNSAHGDEIFTIVGSEEADPVAGKISNESPMGKSFLGHRAGDKVEVKTPGGITQYEIAEIR